MNDVKINPRQFQILVMMFVLGSSSLITPTLLTSEAKQDAWISGLVGILFGFVVILLYNKLATLYPNHSFTEYAEIILGKWLGKLVSIYFFIFLLALLTGLIRQTGDFLTTQIIVETPIEFITIIFILSAIYGVYLGLETFGRASEIFYPIIMILILFFIVFLPQQMEFENIKPILENGWVPVSRGAIQLLGLPFFDLVVLLMIFPATNDKKIGEKSFIKGFLFGAIIIVTLVLTCILVLGSNLTEEKIYPTYTLAKKINIGDFIQRIEAVAAIIWLITIFFKVLICFYSAIQALTSIFNLKNPKALLFPFGMILYVLAKISSPNLPYFYETLEKTWFPFSLSSGLLLPTLILIVGLIKKRKKPEQTSPH